MYYNIIINVYRIQINVLQCTNSALRFNVSDICVFPTENSLASVRVLCFPLLYAFITSSLFSSDNVFRLRMVM